MTEEKKKRGLFGKAVDALTTRDEKEAAAEAAKAAEEAKAQVAREASLRQLAEAKAAEAERKAAEMKKQMEEAAKVAEAEARVAASRAKFEAEAAARKAEVEKQMAEEAAKIAEARAAAVAAAEAAKKTYVVKPGDSLSKIAKEQLGNASRWPEIFELNKDQIKDPNLIRVGQELQLPD